MNIASDVSYQSRFVEVHGSKMHYLEQGSGDPILFLHGMPTSSHLWRNIIPHLATLGRCIAPDLIGMGKSDKPDIEYTVFDHIKYVDEFIAKLNLKNVTVIMHGWGSIIGIDYAMRHEKNCKALVFYEAYLQPLIGEYLSLPYQEQLYELQENDFDITANGVRFIDQILPQIILRSLTEEELQPYRAPFMASGSGKPLNQYVQEILPKQSDTINQLIIKNAAKLEKSKLPKLMLYAVPGFITTIATVMWAKEHLSNIEIIEMSESLHCIQETDPDIMGETISMWLQGVEQSVV